MTTATPPPWYRRWSAKKYILAALLAAMVTALVVASISISLAPAHITFSIVYADITKIPLPQDPKRYFWYYNFTLVTNNTSHRTEVLYTSLSANIWRSETAWIPTEEANTTAELPDGVQPPGNIAHFNLSVEGGQYNEETTTAPPAPPLPPPPPSPPPGAADNNQMDNGNSKLVDFPNCRVVVEAKVQFRYLRVPTLPYKVTASCFPVNFTAGSIVPAVNCTG